MSIYFSTNYLNYITGAIKQKISIIFIMRHKENKKLEKTQFNLLQRPKPLKSQIQYVQEKRQQDPECPSHHTKQNLNGKTPPITTRSTKESRKWSSPRRLSGSSGTNTDRRVRKGGSQKMTGSSTQTLRANTTRLLVGHAQRIPPPASTRSGTSTRTSSGFPI